MSVSGLPRTATISANASKSSGLFSRSCYRQASVKTCCLGGEMSLKRRFSMLGIDHQQGRRKATEPGTDAGRRVGWTMWKTKGRFSTSPTALGNRWAISTFAPFSTVFLCSPGKPKHGVSYKCQGKVEIERHDSHFPPHRQPAAQRRRFCLGGSRFRDARTNLERRPGG